MWAAACVSCGVGYMGGAPAPVDPCMDGEFVYRPDVCVSEEPDRPCEIWFLMTQDGGAVGVTAAMGPEPLAPWESLHFTGGIGAIGEARGTLTAYFADGSVSIANVAVRLSDVAGCPDRLELGPFGYADPDGVPRTESYTANRTAPCTRRRPGCD